MRHVNRITQFMEAVVGTSDSAKIETRQFKPGQKPLRRFNSSDREFVQSVWGSNQHALGWDQYFGVGLRHDNDGSKAGVQSVRALWADLDGKDYMGGKPEALQRLSEFPIAPAFIVDSGNGLHAYWPMNEPVRVQDSKHRLHFESGLRQLARALGADESVAEVARVMRIPGTYNWKDPRCPLPTSFVKFAPDQNCNFEDFEHYPEDKPVESPAIHKSTDWVSDALSDLQVGNRNITITRLVGKLHRDKWSAEDISMLLWPHAERAVMERQEYERVIASVCSRYPQDEDATQFQISPPYIEEKTEIGLRTPVLLSDLLQESNTQENWLIEGLIPCDSASIISAQANLGKTWLLMDLAIAIAQGSEWMNYFPVQKGKVLYIDEESNRHLVKERMNRLLAGRNLSSHDLEIGLFVAPNPLYLRFDNVHSLKALDVVLEGFQPDVVIVDSLIRVHRANENSSTEMAAVFANVKERVNRYNCSFIFADHEGKPTEYNRSAGDRLRGTSEKRCFVDALLPLSKSGNNLVLIHDKARNSAKLGRFEITFSHSEDSSTITCAKMEATESRATKKEQVETAIIEWLQSHNEWKSREEIIFQISSSQVYKERAVSDAIKRLADNGDLERDDRKPESGRGGRTSFFRAKSKEEKL